MEAELVGRGTGDETKLSNIEKHELIRNALLDLISRTEDGEALPPERGLADDLNVARMTVRKVVDMLVGQGYLRRVPGKGTFVTRSRLVKANSYVPFAHYGHGVSTAESKVLELVEEDAGSRIGQRLQLAPSAVVTRITRVSLIGDEPVAIERIHLPTHLFPTLRENHFTSLTLDDLYHQEFGIKVSHSSQVLRVTSINQFESDTLGVPLHAPAFFVTTTKTDIEDRIVEYTEAVYRGDKYRFLNETRAESTYPTAPAGDRALFNAHFIIN